VAVNYATGGGHSLWMWVAVAVLTAGVFAASLWTQSTQSSTLSNESTRGVFLRKIKSQGGLSADGVRSSGTGVEIAGGQFGGDMEFKNITGGDASHP
jgi:hypothetical protein